MTVVVVVSVQRGDLSPPRRGFLSSSLGKGWMCQMEKMTMWRTGRRGNSWCRPSCTATRNSWQKSWGGGGSSSPSKLLNWMWRSHCPWRKACKVRFPCLLLGGVSLSDKAGHSLSCLKASLFLGHTYSVTFSICVLVKFWERGITCVQIVTESMLSIACTRKDSCWPCRGILSLILRNEALNITVP